MKLVFTVRVSLTNLMKNMLQRSVNAVTFLGMQPTPPISQTEQGQHYLWCRYAATLAAPLTRSEDWPFDWSQPVWHWASERHPPAYHRRGTKANVLCLNQHLHPYQCTAELFLSSQWMLRLLCPGSKWIECLALCVSGSEHVTAGTGSNVWTVDSQCDDGRSMCLVI